MTDGMAQTTDTLAKSSPFMSATMPEAASGPTETIEFAAVRIIGDRTEIDLYDTQGKKNHWVPLGMTVDGLTVVGYDAHRDQVTAKIGGVNKLLKLRQTKGGTHGVPGVIAAQPTNMSFATSALPPPVAPPAPVATAPVVEISTNASPTTAAPAPAPAEKQPAAPLTIARQEEEARMLVSDLLEIGMAQRKAYEEKQKQAADPNAANAANTANTATATSTPTSTTTPPPPGGPPSGS